MAGQWRGSGGSKIARIRREIAELNSMQMRVGWMESARYADGKPVAGIAVVQEYGTEDLTIPPRSFMRTTQDEKKIEWDSNMKKGFTAVIKGTRTSAQVMEALGLMAAGDVRKKITQIFTPPLAISTIKARARKAGPSARAISIKPLNDSGLMLATLTHVVTGGDE
ncbi:hypothetical protein [Yersinia pseudotuberculosis]|uniref:hypothetical protein n=1 Tax=Yersinia pseudotuberculosis TaxID=633 RepID=UPI00065D14CC|nr:hypothetical protein [Yersinia pseudotuberculosis]CRY71473.1 Uncharacterised protein [Yersinia pseudotuberculosis]